MRLKDITARLLGTNSNFESMQAATDLHAFFSGIVEIGDDFRNLDRQDTQLGEGRALSPDEAVRCILDFMRTRSFLGGLNAAIVEAQRRFPGQTIHVLYAGCGPFAPLALPLTTQFTSDQVGFTLLDIHQRSLDAARQIVQTLGLSSYIRSYVRADAASERDVCESAPHIVLTETMQKALANEPQVAIMRNLVSQLCNNGILIPQKITLTACLADLGKEFDLTPLEDADSTKPKTGRERIHLGNVFEVSAESAREAWTELSKKESDGALCSNPVRVRVPPIPDDIYELMILTDIMVFDSFALSDYESGLTYPTVLERVGCIHSNAEVEFQYVTGQRPGLRYKFV